ncbi:MAG: NAD(P)-dependent glycerol-3-phosphate dehydrogenase [Oscillospiraceae bacterium]|nr:NAD(P)-dependent glycerol-3-phosphate dehydrogenase [Oscillospiraceae bacterium]
MKAAVVGSGAWGTALAIRLCRNGHDVVMWTRDPEKAAAMRQTRRCPRLPGTRLPDHLMISSDYDCVSGRQLVVIASPSFPIRSVCRGVAPHLDADAVLVSVTKGIERESLKRMSEVVAEETNRPVVVLTGPSHAEEVALDMPTGCLAASGDKALAEFVQDAFISEQFRVYTSADPIGAELGGALKNVIALCAGVSDGLGCGDNTKAMLMSRGLTEMARLGISLGAHRDTFAGLSGVGDLIVTCTSMHSRNRRAGILIGQGKGVQEAMEEVGAVVEGYYAAESAWALCRKQGVEMPILQAAHEVLYQGIPARKAMHNLMTRKRKSEEDMGWMGWN